MYQYDKFRKHFPRDLVVTPMRDAKYWRVVETFSYKCTDEYGGLLIDVHESFATDFASVPSPIRWLIPKWGRYGWAAVVHDWLYSEQKYCKEFADDVFHQAMLISGVSPIKSKMMYWAVKWFGCFAWHSAETKKIHGKNKRALSGTNGQPDWNMPLGQQILGIYQGYQKERELWKSRKL